jgi:beta-glucosidase
VVTPVMELKRFSKISLMPGEMKKVEFTIKPEDLTLLDKHLKPVVEPGKFDVMVGSSSSDIRLNGDFEIK